MSRISARLPPTVRWMLTAMTTKPKLVESRRPAIDSSAASEVMPSWISEDTRASSVDVGSAPSRMTLLSAELNAWPAFREAAMVISISGSWASNAAWRRLALSRT